MLVTRLFPIFLVGLALTAPPALAGAESGAQNHSSAPSNTPVAGARSPKHTAKAGIRVDIEALRQRQLDAIKALHDGRCDYALARYKLADDQITSAPNAVLRAHLHWRGLCFKQDSAKAAHFLTLALDYSPRNANALALLGTLYWRGDGVPKNQDKARTLFRRAMLEQAPQLIDDEYSTIQRNGDTAAHRYWGLTNTELDRGFTLSAVGPWDLPEPLAQQLTWFDTLKSDGGKVMEIAFALRNGTDGYAKDPVLAFQWLQAASLYLDFGPSHFPMAQWLRDDALFALRVQAGITRPKYRDSEYGFANVDLLRAAEFGDVRAEREILRLLKAGPDYEKRNWAIYYWLLRLKSHGENIPAQDIKAARADVEPKMRVVIEKWDANRIRNGKPLEPFYTRLPDIP